MRSPIVAVAHRGAIGSSPMGDGPSTAGDGALMARYRRLASRGFPPARWTIRSRPWGEEDQENVRDEMRSQKHRFCSIERAKPCFPRRTRHVQKPGQPPVCGDRRARERVPVAALGRVDPHEFGPPNRILDRPGDDRRGQRPYLWFDATYAKARDGGRIVSRAVIVAVAVNEDGKREGEPLMRSSIVAPSVRARWATVRAVANGGGRPSWRHRFEPDGRRSEPHWRRRTASPPAPPRPRPSGPASAAPWPTEACAG